MADKQTIIIRGVEYPVSVEGEGAPCLAIFNGTQVQRSLSAEFKKKFKVYGVDLYMDAPHTLADNSSVSMDMCLNDVHAVVEQLGLKSYLLLGHSAYGIMALAYARKYPGHAAGILMVSTPFNWSDAVAQHNMQIFDAQADSTRKAADAQLREEAAAKDMAGMSDAEKFAYEMGVRDAARYWHDYMQDTFFVWDGIALSDTLFIIFDQVFPAYDVTNDLPHITDSVFLAAGMSDFDSCPVQGWSTRDDLPASMEISVFEQSGHWPHHEKAALFNARVFAWWEKVA